MSVSRYKLRDKVVNFEEIFKEQFKKRGVKMVRHYRSPVLKYPNREQLLNLKMIQHIWRTGDRYEKLAHKFYGDTKMWWVIAWINKRPAEFLNKAGDIIYIPKSLDDALIALDI